jgi:serine/threonine protein kinase
MVCTPEYRAPEIYFHTNYYTEKSDIWSYGCVIVYLFTQKIAFPTLAVSEHGPDLGSLQNIFYLLGTPNAKTWPDY